MASLAATYPLQFNTTQIPYPSSYSTGYETIENSYTSEAGTDLVQVTRYKKKTWSMGFNCLESVAQTLEGFSDVDSFTLHFYDVRTGASTTATVRMRDFSMTLIPGTDKLTYCNGLYQVSFKLIEF